MVATITGRLGNTSLIDAAMAPISAPMFIVFAIRRRIVIGKTIFLEYFCFIIPPNPLPVTRPILAHISCTAVIIGYRTNTNQAIPNPNCAPACEYVAIPDGSASDAPVIIPGPNLLRIVLCKEEDDDSLFDNFFLPCFTLMSLSFFCLSSSLLLPFRLLAAVNQCSI